MKFAKGAVKALEKGKEHYANKAESPILSLVPEDGELVEDDHSKTGSFKLLSNPTDANSPKYQFSMGYADGTQSVRFHIMWKRNVERVLRGLNITAGPAMFSMVQQLCRGSVLTAFEKSIRYDQEALLLVNAETARQNAPARTTTETRQEHLDRLQAVYDAVIAGPKPDPTTRMIDKGLQAAAGYAIPFKALEYQKRFMRRKMRKPVEMPIRKYVGHLLRINDEELPHLPPYNPMQILSEDEMMDIVMFGIPKSWEKQMNIQNFDPFRAGTTMLQVVEFCERLEANEDSPTVTRNNTSSNGNKKAKFQGNDKKDH